MEIWPVVIAAGVLLTAIITIIMTNSSKFLSIREHETYRAYATREMDITSRRLDIIEQTRPTTGELEARLQTGRFQEPRTCQPTTKK
jgi:hypothetical protein